jgi:hypothetical protein
MGRLFEVSRQNKKTGFFPKAAAQTGATESDNTATRIAKLVPAEIVAGYVPLVAAAESVGTDKDFQFKLACAVFFLGFVLTPIYLIGTGKPGKDIVKWINVVSSTIAFGLWAYLLGGAFAMEQMKEHIGHPYDKQLGGFLVGAFTWIIACLPLKRLPPPPDADKSHDVEPPPPPKPPAAS